MLSFIKLDSSGDIDDSITYQNPNYESRTNNIQTISLPSWIFSDADSLTNFKIELFYGAKSSTPKFSFTKTLYEWNNPSGDQHIFTIDSTSFNLKIASFQIQNMIFHI